MFSQPSYNRIIPLQYSQYQNEIPLQTQAIPQSQYGMTDNMSCYSGASTNTGISQLSSVYITNQKRKTLTDEIITCLNSSIENLLPSIAQQSAEMIYKAILPYIEKQDKEIKELQIQIDVLENVFKSLKFLGKNPNSLKNLSNISNQLNGLNTTVENCNLMLDNQMAVEKGNFEFMYNHNEKINKLKEKMNLLKTMLTNEKETINTVNSNINGAFSDFIGLKKGIDTQLGTINKNLKFGKNIFDGGEKNTQCISQLEKIIDNFNKDVTNSDEIRLKYNCVPENNFMQNESNYQKNKNQISGLFQSQKFSC